MYEISDLSIPRLGTYDVEKFLLIAYSNCDLHVFYLKLCLVVHGQFMIVCIKSLTLILNITSFYLRVHSYNFQLVKTTGVCEGWVRLVISIAFYTGSDVIWNVCSDYSLSCLGLFHLRSCSTPLLLLLE